MSRHATGASLSIAPGVASAANSSRLYLRSEGRLRTHPGLRFRRRARRVNNSCTVRELSGDFARFARGPRPRSSKPFPKRTAHLENFGNVRQVLSKSSWADPALHASSAAKSFVSLSSPRGQDRFALGNRVSFAKNRPFGGRTGQATGTSGYISKLIRRADRILRAIASQLGADLAAGRWNRVGLGLFRRRMRHRARAGDQRLPPVSLVRADDLHARPW